MSKSDGTKAAPIGAEEYILICKKVADKLRDVPGIETDATAQAFIATTDTVYAKLHKEPIVEEADKPKTTFLICPVRGVDPKETESIVKDLEDNGTKVHWPPRDTNQDDPIGFDICTQNKQAIKDADEVHVVWDEKSQGCLFDLGMAFSMDKKINIVDIPEGTSQKSFQNMMGYWAEVK
ncbi:hypothetical protein KAR91_51375 [Candidatus Pacearchaeota archaeon]|nr:hypothetical protein [Candidatus Pacearchaeota archaeon]